MDTVFIVETKEIATQWSFVESVHSSPESAEIARKDRQRVWGNGTTLNPRTFYVSVREMPILD